MQQSNAKDEVQSQRKSTNRQVQAYFRERLYTQLDNGDIHHRRSEKYPVTYKLVDHEDRPIEGNFYQEEVTKVKYPDAYFVVKVVGKSRNKVFVKRFFKSHKSDK